MMTCRDAVEVIASGQKLSKGKRVALWLHLVMCRSCTGYREHLRTLKRAVGRLLAALPRPSEQECRRLEDKIIARLLVGKK